jgi:hypothetical protein
MSDQQPEQQPQKQPAPEEAGRPLVALTDRAFAQQLLGFAECMARAHNKGLHPRASRPGAIGSHRQDFGQDIVGDLFGIKVNQLITVHAIAGPT